jgi:hypothetical protein
VPLYALKGTLVRGVLWPDDCLGLAAGFAEGAVFWMLGFLAATLVAFFMAGFFAEGFVAVVFLAVVFLGAGFTVVVLAEGLFGFGFPVVVFLAAAFAVIFPAAGFFGIGFLAVAFLPGGFLEAGRRAAVLFTPDFLAADFPAEVFLAVTFFAVDFFEAFFTAGADTPVFLPAAAPFTLVCFLLVEVTAVLVDVLLEAFLDDFAGVI